MNHQKDTDKKSIITRESVGFTLAAFLLLMLIMSATGSLVFSDLGAAVQSFILGVFGIGNYFILVWFIFLSVILIIGKNPIHVKGFSLFLTLFIVSLFFTIHNFVTADLYVADPSAYLGACFAAGQNGVGAATPFGVVGGVLVYALRSLVAPAVTHVIFIAVTLVFFVVFLRIVLKAAGVNVTLFSALKSKKSDGEKQQGEKAPVQQKNTVQDPSPIPENSRQASTFEPRRQNEGGVPPYVSHREERQDTASSSPRMQPTPEGQSDPSNRSNRYVGRDGREYVRANNVSDQGYGNGYGNAPYGGDNANNGYGNAPYGGDNADNGYDPYATSMRPSPSFVPKPEWLVDEQNEDRLNRNGYGQSDIGNRSNQNGGKDYFYYDPNGSSERNDRPQAFVDDRPQAYSKYIRDEVKEDDHTSFEGNIQFLYGKRQNPDEYRSKNLIFDKNSKFNARSSSISTPESSRVGGNINTFGQEDVAPTGTAWGTSTQHKPSYKPYSGVSGSSLGRTENASSGNSYSQMSTRAMNGDITPAQNEKRVVNEESQQTASRGFSLYNKSVFGTPSSSERTSNPSATTQNDNYDRFNSEDRFTSNSRFSSDNGEAQTNSDRFTSGGRSSFDFEHDSDGNDRFTSTSSDRFGGNDESERFSSNNNRFTSSSNDRSFASTSGLTSEEYNPNRGFMPKEENDRFSSSRLMGDRTSSNSDTGSDGSDERVFEHFSDDRTSDRNLDNRTVNDRETFNRDLTPSDSDTENRQTDRRGDFRAQFSENSSLTDRTSSLRSSSIFDDDSTFPDEEEEKPSVLGSSVAARAGLNAGVDVSGRGVTVSSDGENLPQPIRSMPKPRVIKDYKRPPVEMLLAYDSNIGANQEEVERIQRAIVETLEGYNIFVNIQNVINGPVFSRYDINLPKSVDYKNIVRYNKEIALAVHTESLNIYPNFQEGTVSIEVPNSRRATVGLRPMLNSEEYRNAKPGSLVFAVGVDSEGKCVCDNLADAPHMLVAGTSGSGKSVFLHEIIVSLIMHYSPEELRFIMIDPKYTEFSIYENLPHLMINKILTEAKSVIVALNWAINEMERRYMLFAQMGKNGRSVRNIDEYNSAVEKREDRLPKIVIIADEVADLMLSNKNDIENRVNRIAAKARASGIHLVLATQRPSTNIITGILKANLNTRVALMVAQEVDSRVILDKQGAEKLLGKGDLLYRNAKMKEPKRLQSAWIDTPEIQKICEFIKNNNEAYFDESVAAYIESDGKVNLSNDDGFEEEEEEKEIEAVYIDALRYVVQIGTASISMIQRKCGVGFNKAGKIVEWMEQNNYISAFDGAKSRKVLITKDEFIDKFGEI